MKIDRGKSCIGSTSISFVVKEFCPVPTLYTNISKRRRGNALVFLMSANMLLVPHNKHFLQVHLEIEANFLHSLTDPRFPLRALRPCSLCYCLLSKSKDANLFKDMNRVYLRSSSTRLTDSLWLGGASRRNTVVLSFDMCI